MENMGGVLRTMRIIKHRTRGVVIVAALAAALCAVAILGIGKAAKEAGESKGLIGCLAEPGREFAARRLAVKDIENSLAAIEKILDDPPAPGMKPRALLIKGDLLLASGDAEGALACFRQVQALAARDEDLGWDEGGMPRDYYPVEPPSLKGGHRLPWFSKEGARPFTMGPGSLRDNWLIRRFAALDAWDECGKEYERMWEVHLRRAGEEQFDGLGLQFSVDYACFLRAHGDPALAEEVLALPLLRIDFDENPNMRRRRESLPVMFASLHCGISRREFVRVAQGALSDGEKLEGVMETLRERIAGGSNRSRRILARILMHQGEVDEALALEFGYLEAGGFDALSVAYRRGRLYEDYQKTEEAAAEYERVLSMDYAPLQLADPEEEAQERDMMAQAYRRPPSPGTPERRSTFHTEVLGRLEGLYASLGEREKALDVTLRRLEANARMLANTGLVLEAAREFRAAGRWRDFANWAQGQAGEHTNTLILTNLAWATDDYTKAAELLGGLAATDPKRDMDAWKKRFRAVGPEALLQLLKALMEANPANARSRLEWLGQVDPFEGPEVVEALELLLGGSQGCGLRWESKGDSIRTRTKFQDCFDLAYRLMRLYEKNGSLEKLRVLGQRIAAKETPFEYDDWRHRNHYEGPDYRNACLALAIEHGDAASLGALAESLVGPENAAARSQLEKRTAVRWPPSPEPGIGWANLPEGVTALVGHGEVLSLAHDARHLYAGMPWGVAVHDHEGEPVTRVALEEAVLHLAVQGENLWAGTATGLCRVALDTWEVARIPLDLDVPPRGRDPREAAFNNGVCCLAYDGKCLWIGTRRNVQCLDVQENTLRIFSPKETLVSSHASWSRIIFDESYVWISSGGGARRYDRDRERWEEAAYEGGGPVELLGLEDGNPLGAVGSES